MCPVYLHVSDCTAKFVDMVAIKDFVGSLKRLYWELNSLFRCIVSANCVIVPH